MNVIAVKNVFNVIWNFIRDYPRVLFYWKGELERVEFFFYSIITFCIASVFESHYINSPIWLLKYDGWEYSKYGYVHDILKDGMQRIPRGNPYYIYPAMFIWGLIFYCFSCVFSKRYKNMGCKPYYGFLLSFYFLIWSFSQIIDDYFDSINILGEKPEEGDLGDFFLRDYQLIYFYIRYSVGVALFYWFFFLCMVRGNKH
jgi:hypothetical protein